MRKLLLTFILLPLAFAAGCKNNANLFKDPSSVDPKAALMYRVNSQDINMPVLFRLPSDKSNISLKFEKPGVKAVSVSLQHTIDGWSAFSGKTVSSGEDFGLIIDFTSGAVYEMPKNDVKTVISGFSPDNVTVIKELVPGKGNNITFTKMTAVDGQKLYNKEELKHLALLNGLDLASQNKSYDSNGNGSYGETPRVEGNKSFNTTNKNAVITDRPVITAAANGQYDRLLKMLDNKGNIDEIDPATGNNALLFAVGNADEEISNLLLDRGIDANRKNNAKQSALHIASNFGLYNIAERLLKMGLGVNDKDNGGNTPLMYAAASPNNYLADMLIENGAKPEDRNKNGETPLLIAARTGNTKTVASLASKGANPMAVDNEGNGAIMKAAEENNKYTLQNLIKMGVPVDLKNRKGFTPLQVTVGKGNTDIAKVLLQSGADVNMKDPMGNTPLITAVGNGDTPMVQELLKYQPNILLTDREDRNAYMIAKDKGYPQIQRILGQNMKTFDTASVLLFEKAAANDADGAVKAIEMGANPNARDKNTGNTPLFTAVANNYLYMAQTLIKNGADVNIRNNKGNIPLIIAVTSSDHAMIETLINAKSHVNAANNNGDTALIWAVKLKNTDMVRMLLTAGADPNKKNNDGVSPYMIAYNEGNDDILGLLQAAGGYR